MTSSFTIYFTTIDGRKNVADNIVTIDRITTNTCTAEETKLVKKNLFKKIQVITFGFTTAYYAWELRGRKEMCQS